MAKQNILYSRIKLDQLPEDAKILLSKTLDKITYEKNKRNMEEKEKELDFLPETSSYSFLKLKLNNEINGWFKIVLEFDTIKFEEMVKKSYELRNRKNLFNILEKCYYEYVYNYVSHLMINMFEEILVDNKKPFIQWMKEREMDNNFHSYPHMVMKIGNSYVNIDKGEFVDNVEISTFKANGGIIVDKTSYLWINHITNLLCQDLNRSLDVTVNPFTINPFIYTNCNLIICNQIDCNLWKNKLELGQKKVYLITNKKD